MSVGPQLPMHDWFIIQHNPHNNMPSTTLKSLIEKDEWDDNVWLTTACKASAIEANDVWMAIWGTGYNTGVSFVCSPDLVALMTYLNSVREAEVIREQEEAEAIATDLS